MTAPLSFTPDSDSNDSCMVEKKDIESGKSKKIIKGGRLGLYPAGMKLYRCSRGIKKPIVEDMPQMDARKKVKGMEKTFERTIELKDDKTDFHGFIKTEVYRKV